MPETDRSSSLNLSSLSLGPVALVVALIVLLGALLTAIALRQQHLREEKIARTQDSAAETIAAMDENIEQVRPLTGTEMQAMRRFLNPVHLEHARQYGVTTPSDREEATRLIQSDSLAPIEPNAYYNVARMDHSVPAVTPDTRNLLQVIGQRFQSRLDTLGLPPFRFRVTSATRTVSDQNRLRQGNVNAAQNSAHTYGTTVDIHYARFDIRPEEVPIPEDADIDTELYRETVAPAIEELAETQNAALKAILGRVMLELQDEGSLVFVHERRQPVYHFTVADEIPEPTPPAGTLATTTPTAGSSASTR